MTGRQTLKLDISDSVRTDTLRGPGSSLTEPMPSGSPAFYSPLPSSVNSDQNTQGNITAFDALRSEHQNHQPSGQAERCLHIVVVGGDIGAFLTALALTKSEQVRVTLVNAGLGPFSILGAGGAVRSSQLTARTLAYLDDLGNWRGSSYQASHRDIPFALEDRSTRWKGKGSTNDLHSIGERIREEGYCLRSSRLLRYIDGEELGLQEYAICTGEDVSMIAIDMDAFITILRDACLSHPRIDVRPRGVVRAVLPGSVAPSLPHQNNSRGIATNTSEATIHDSRRSDAPERQEPSKGDPERRRKARESFIQFADDDDDEEDDMSSLHLVPPNTPGIDAPLRELLRNLPSPPPRPNTFLPPEDLPTEEPSSPMFVNDETKQYKPAVVLTSGEHIEADVVLGTEGPESKVLDCVCLTASDTHVEEMVREDGIFIAAISISRVLEDPEVRVLAGQAVTWLGPGRSLASLPVNNNLLHVTLTVEGGRARPDVVDEDEDAAVAHQMKREVADWEPRARKLVALVDSAAYTPVFDRNPLEQWISVSGRVAVLGNAAHPLLPFSHQGLSAIIDDALTLGALFQKSLARPPEHHLDRRLCPRYLVPRLLHAFATLRRPHCVRKQLFLREGRDLSLLPDGKDQRHRDEMLKKGGLFSEEEKRVEWLFDPFEEVETWWAAETRVLNLE